MVYVFAILVAMATQAHEADAEHAKYLRLHKEWMRLHEADGSPSQLIVDPRINAMWIETQGEVHNGSTVELPKGFRWYAFHVSQDGVTIRSFPIRLEAPRAATNDESTEELLWVVAMADQKAFRLSFSATRSGTGFHVGSGSRTGDVTIQLPAALAKPTEYKSFVASQGPRASEPKDFIQMREFAVQVKRRTTPPNAE